MSEKQEIQVNDSIKVVFKTHTDDNYEPDHYGSFGNQVREWCIDRKLQVLYGGPEDEPLMSDELAELEDKHDDWVRHGDGWSDDFNKDHHTLYHRLINEYEISHETWQNNNGLKVLSDDVYVYHRYDSAREHRFYYPSENYKDETDENKMKYMLEDHKRYEKLLDGQWCYLGFEVEVWVEDIKITSESVWGLESDMDRDDKEEVWGELLDQCFSNVTKKISDMVNVLQRGFSALPSQETIADLVKEIK